METAAFKSLLWSICFTQGIHNWRYHSLFKQENPGDMRRVLQLHHRNSNLMHPYPEGIDGKTPPPFFFFKLVESLLCDVWRLLLPLMDGRKVERSGKQALIHRQSGNVCADKSNLSLHNFRLNQGDAFPPCPPYAVCCSTARGCRVGGSEGLSVKGGALCCAVSVKKRSRPAWVT